MTKHQQETMFPQQCFLHSQKRQTCCNLRVFGVVFPGLKIKITQELSVLGPLVRSRTSRSLVRLALTSKHWQLACDLILP